MHDPFTREELIAALAARSREVAQRLEGFSAPEFLVGSTKAWGPAQHATHLAFSHERVARAFRAGRALPAASGPSRGYDAVRDAYLSALATAPSALLTANADTGALEEATSPAAVVARYTTASTALRDAAGAWSEPELDARAIPHPLLGPIPAREMLLFMLYHDLHHLEGMQRPRPHERA